MWVSYCSGHDGHSVLDFCKLGIEVFLGRGWRTNGDPRRQKAEASSEFCREGWAQDIYVVRPFGGIAGDGVGDGSG